MKMVPVLTPEQLAAMSEEEILDLTSAKAVPMAPTLTHSDDSVRPYFFITTESGSKEIKLPPRVEIIVTESRR